MKIDRLYLKAFGCFTDVELDFSGAQHGMFVLYGLNEAGKSIALEGLCQWLYEIKRDLALDFKHKKTKQRVGGIVSTNGQRLRCFRKRGNANTLVNENDKPIGDEALRPFLRGIDESRFRTIFGINHDRLREGGQEIAAGKGDLGQALFAAGSGLRRLDRILKQLVEAQGNLFAVRGEKPAINSSLMRCQEIKDKLSKERLSLAEVKQNHETLADLQRKREELNEKLSQLEQERNKVDRLIRVTPLVTRHKTLRSRLQPIQSAIRLREDFRSDFDKIDRGLLKERENMKNLSAQLKGAEEELKRIPSDPEALEEEARLKQLSDSAGQYQTDFADLPDLRLQVNLKQGEAKQMLRRLGRKPSLEPEDIEPLRIDDQMRNRIRTLGTKRAEHFTNTENSSKLVNKLELEFLSTQTELGELTAPADTETLIAVVNRITKMGDLEGTVKDAQHDLAEHERVLREERLRLTLWSGGLDEIPGVPIPSAHDIDYHGDQIEKARGRREDAEDQVSQHHDRLIEVQAQIERLRQTGSVPSEQDLEAERSRRQDGWRLIRSAWLDGKRNETVERDWIKLRTASGERRIGSAS